MAEIISILLPAIAIVLIIHALKLVSLLRFILLVALAIASTFFIQYIFCEVLTYDCPSDPLVGLGYVTHSLLVIAVSFIIELARTNLIIYLKANL